MPPKQLFPLSSLDTSRVLATREEVYQVNPHRYEFQQLDGIYLLDVEKGCVAGYKDVGEDEFWVRGHIPGRPVFPGVLMIEAAAQLVSYCVMTRYPDKGFLGFGGVDSVKFRGVVVPGQRIVMLGEMLEMRPRRCKAATQGFVDGHLVYEGVITGMWL